MRTVVARSRRGIAVVAALAAASACGPAPDPGGHAAAPDNVAATQAAPCTTNELTADLQAQHPAAGGRYAVIRLSKTTGGTCTLHGYGRIRLVGQDGRAVPTRIRREAGPEPAPVRLERGTAARQHLRWGVVPVGDEPVTGPCQPPPGHLDLVPPGGGEPLRVSWSYGPVCGHGTITVSPYQPW
ncbi:MULTISPECIES: DUF4232 domain-containing protein [Amycolatopsis]|uniref:DUF4232 domain-containing protein n=1 Tax=Amycolatopsis TaxID=1813 RepID=UPI000B8B5291|nr:MULTISPECIES: DUF4232 domain-containing protein [Amycolatopsis]OXM75127.1 hypothetical protein CF166_00590 [Amycolatopsis sp. KNN50.9b]